MTKIYFASVAAAVLLSTQAFAQGDLTVEDDGFVVEDPTTLAVQDPELLLIAEQSGVCGDFGVASAVLREDGQIHASCLPDPTAFVPLAGGLAPVLGAGAAVAALVAGSGGGDATPDTQ